LFAFSISTNKIERFSYFKSPSDISQNKLILEKPVRFLLLAAALTVTTYAAVRTMLTSVPVMTKTAVKPTITATFKGNNNKLTVDK
jgi:hypothetical protein